MSLEAFAAAFKRKPPKVEPEDGEKWVSWDEWQYRAVHTYLDTVARKRGRRPKAEAWEAYLADHLERVTTDNLERDVEGLENNTGGTDSDSGGSIA